MMLSLFRDTVITGSGFISTSAVQWNGTSIATTFNSATSLSAAVPVVVDRLERLFM